MNSTGTTEHLVFSAPAHTALPLISSEAPTTNATEAPHVFAPLNHSINVSVNATTEAAHVFGATTTHNATEAPHVFGPV